MELIPINKRFEPMASNSPIKPVNEEGDGNIKTIIDKSMGLGALPRKYLPFPDNKFGVWVDEENFYIGDNHVLADGNDLIISNERYKGTHGLWKLLTNPSNIFLNTVKHNCLILYPLRQHVSVVKRPSSGLQ